MVTYCCVKGCKSNGNNKKKDLSSMLSFHAFPRNTVQKSKWAKAIGRPNWLPSSHVRICSMHFNHDQINYEGCRIRIKDDAVPTKNLPLNSNFEATAVEACRICLATDLKLHSLQESHLGNCMDSITGFNTNCNIEGLPQYVCYQCAPCLIKFYKFVEKGMIAQATLLDIFAEYSEITTDLIKQLNRDKLNLTSSLKCCKTENYFHYKISDENCTEMKSNSDYFDDDFENGRHSEAAVLTTNAIENDNFEMETEDKFEVVIQKNDVKEEMIVDDDFDDSRLESFDDISSDNEVHKNEAEIIKSDKVKKKKSKSKNKMSQKILVQEKDEEIRFEKADVEKYFDVVDLSLEEQIQEWKKSPLKIPMTSDKIYECQVCYKLFAQHNIYRVHIASHDPSRGEHECPICKLRLKTDVLTKSHINRAHAKKYYCKTCHKSFNNVRAAKQHYRWHSGYKYKCSMCTYKSAHLSALGAHVRRAHAHSLACAVCGRAAVNTRGLRLHLATAHPELKETDLNKAYRCEACDINFASEGARRVHLLTSKQHRKTSDIPIVEELKNTCSKCGTQFSSRSELVSHTRAEHPRPKAKCKEQDAYPTQCQLCGETISSRRQHSQHVRRKHPKETDAYRPIVTCVCDTCGHGFQNTTKLQLHQLRHRAPTVRCNSCPRLFYDKYALARHATTHITNKPHQCRTCGRAFKHRSNLDRHCSSVHSDVAPYECSMCGKKFKYSSSVNLHIRSVHFKLPLPPRKRKTKTTKTLSEGLC